jgi:hypothetical protein
MKTFRLLPVVFLAVTAALRAQTPAPQGPPVPGPEIHQFDFWVGEWDVGARAHSKVEKVADGLALLESWTGGDGKHGSSLNTFNLVSKRWQQFWVGTGTPVLELSGGLVDGKMVLAGDRVMRSGATVRDRITWTPNADGTVEQTWDVSRDGGKTWSTVFQNLYTRKK